MRKCCRCRGEAPPSAAASGDEKNGGGMDGEGGSGEEGVGDGHRGALVWLVLAVGLLLQGARG